MKIIYFSIAIFFIALQRSNAAVVRKQPAFSKPVYSNSYLPAAMQVIFHAVDQLKHLQNEEAEEALLSSSTATESLPTTSPHAPGQHQPELHDLTSLSTQSEVLADPELPTESTASIEAATPSVEGATESLQASTESVNASTESTAKTSETPAVLTESTAKTSETPAVLAYENEKEINVKSGVTEETTAEIEAETPERNYETPETNHEIPEDVHEIAETNQEMVENSVTISADNGAVLPTEDESAENSSQDFNEKDSSEESDEESNESKSLSSAESAEQEETDSAEEEDDEIRFTLIGEKVAQVPRPSLTNYLRKRTKSPLRSSLEELASLYDALSKDARKQGYAKFSGYSDEVLKTLETSAEGGVGPQLESLLEKAVIRNELTREDTKIKLNSTLKKLADPSTVLSRDLRRLIPLRYIP